MIGESRMGQLENLSLKWVFAIIVVACCAALLVLAGVPGGQACAAASSEAETEASQDSHALKALDTETPQSTKPTAKQLKAFKKASADFSIELFKRSVAAAGKNANVTIAPMSVLNALAMTANGASGKTLKQLRKVLVGGSTLATLNKGLKWYNQQLVDVDKAHISSANAIWYHNGGSLAINQAFLDTNSLYLDAEAKPADFSNPATVDDVNNWVAAKTNNMIDRIVNQLDPSDRLALVNALYFDAEWASPYDQSDVNDRQFTTSSGKASTVKMMYSTEHRYIKGKNVKGFVRPYAQGYSYVALLPDKGISLKKFVNSLTGNKFVKLVSKAKSAHVHAGLPKYTLEYSSENMGNLLKKMGIRLAFNPRKADFSKMGNDPTGNLFIGEVIHKTKIEVDEQGTKAAAVTAVIMKASSMMLKVKTVILDRPFVYAIVDNATNLPVFIGAVNTL